MCLFLGGGVRVCVYVTHLVSFLWCDFYGGSMLLIFLVFCDVLVLGMSILLILLVFCVVFFCLEGKGGYLCCSSC